MGAFFAVVNFTLCICAVLYLFSLLSRLTRAHERAAGALERIAHKLKSDAP